MARPYLVLGGDIGGTAAAPTVANDAITDAKLRDSAAVSVIGRSANSSGDPADIAASANGHVLRRAGDAVGFGNVLQLEASNLSFRSQMLSTSGTLLLTSGTAYFVYIGRVQVAFTPYFVELHTTVAGVGAQTAEVGIFSSPTAPDNAGQTLTKLAASGSVSDLTSTGIDRNSASLATSVASGVHLWAGVRTAMATTQPTVVGLVGDMSIGAVLATAGATAFTSGSSYTGALIALSAATIAPDLRIIV